MRITLNDDQGVCRLTVEGSLTYESASELEEQIIEAMRGHDRLQLDLSGVVEIDLCGLVQLRTLQALGGSRLTTIAGSPVVERAEQLLLRAELCRSAPR